MKLPLFNRIASVKIGKKGQEQGIIISDLRFTFDIKKNLETTNNGAVIEIYNLGEDTRNKFKEIYDIIIVEAGYLDGEKEKLLFKGDIRETKIRRSGAEIITIIEAGDGIKAINEIKFNKSYSAGFSAYDILEDILNTFGLPKKLTSAIKLQIKEKGKKFANAFSAVGSAKKVLDKITKQLDYEWSVQNGAIKILEKEGVDDSPVIVLSSATGLIDFPVRIHSLKSRKETDKKKVKDAKEKDIQRKGWDVKSLLMADIEPGGRLFIKSVESDIDSAFRVEEVNHKGDTHGLGWNTFSKVADII